MQAECPWVVVAHSKEMAVHAALLPTGKVLYFGGLDVDDTHLYDTPSELKGPGSNIFTMAALPLQRWLAL